MRFQYDYTGISQKQILTYNSHLSDYIQRLVDVCIHNDYHADEASILLPSEKHNLLEIEKKTRFYNKSPLSYFFIVGIGGSNLGTKAVYDALHAPYEKLGLENKPKPVFVDTVDSFFYSALQKLLHQNKLSSNNFLINVITKSGGTTETIANMEYLLSMLPGAKSRLVITSDDTSPLYQYAKRKKVPVLAVPKKVGGRFSVFSPVGLFPLSVLGVDIRSLLKGALEAREKNTANEIIYNPSALSAVILYLLSKKGYIIHDNFFFAPSLESLGKWYRQLMAESLGKNAKGILPTVSIGSTDLHSIAQLYLGGYNHIYFTFYTVENLLKNKDNQVHIPKNPFFPNKASIIKNMTPDQILSSISKGVKRAFSHKNIPFSEIIFDTISTYSIGKFMQFKMLEIMYLGNLLKINTFNQPNVEEYKKETRKILKSL